jgi:lysophospholipase L1-like esterase
MQKRICVFGDSVAWGAYLPKREAWVDLLRNHLEKLSNYSVVLYNLGIDENTSTDLLQRFDSEATARNPDVIIIAIGVNDSIYRGQNLFDVSGEKFTENLITLLGKARTFTDTIWLMGLVKGSDKETIPLKVSTTGKCYSKSAVRQYDEYIRTVAVNKKLPFVDIYADLNDSDFDDGLHPNLQGHIKIFNKIRTMFEKQGLMDFLLS